jgi:transcriptional regulator with XRE-family HTH domain
VVSIHRPKYRLFIELLKEFRVNKGVQQKELAKMIKSEQTVISKYEHFVRRIDFVEFLDICEALNVSVITFVKEFKKRLKDKGIE